MPRVDPGRGSEWVLVWVGVGVLETRGDSRGHFRENRQATLGAERRSAESRRRRAPPSWRRREPRVVAASPKVVAAESPRRLWFRRRRVPRSAVLRGVSSAAVSPSGRRVPRPRRRNRRRRVRSARYTPTTSRSPPRRYSARTSRISRRRRYRLDLGAVDAAGRRRVAASSRLGRRARRAGRR